MTIPDDSARCEKEDEPLVNTFPAPRCFELRNHEGPHRFIMTTGEIQSFFDKLDGVGK